MILKNNPFGIYEKALPDVGWEEKFRIASELGFDFIELSIDENENRIARLDWTDHQIDNLIRWQWEYSVKIRSICFSAQRKFPMGSIDKNTREHSLILMKKCIQFADKIGAKIIQLAGYDVYYEEKNELTKQYFIQGLKQSLVWANQYGVMLAIETMDDPFINSISKYLEITKDIESPWLAVYPDIGNLSAWEKENELNKYSDLAVGLHLKDTLAVTNSFEGKFKKVEFGQGCVQFEKIFKVLKEKNYLGSFLIEAWFEDDEYRYPIKKLKEALDFIKYKMKVGGWEICSKN